MKKYNWKELQEYYNKGYTTEDLKSKFGVHWQSIRKAVQRGDFVLRSKSENMKLAHKMGRSNFAERSKSPERRELDRKMMLKRIEDDPNNHPNRILAMNKGKMSYPEKLVFNYLTELGIDFKHNEYTKPYWPDFKIGKTIIEVDGKVFHNKEKDKIRDEKLNEMGYTVHRFDSQDIVRNVKIIDTVL